jgi:hypothetical protein
MKKAHFIPTNASIVPTRISGPGLRSAWSIKRPGRSLQTSHQENTYRLSHNHMPSLNPRTSSQVITRQSPIPRKSNLPPISAHFLCPPKGQQAPHIYLSPSRPNVHPTHLHARGFTTISASRPRRPPAGSGRSTSYPLRPPPTHH